VVKTIGKEELKDKNGEESKIQAREKEDDIIAKENATYR
jgi:hypothetical protein